MSSNIKAFLFLVGLTSFIGGFLGVFTVLFAGLTTISIVLLNYFWNERAFDRLTVKRELTRSHVNYGDKINYSVTLENKKFLPVLWLNIKDDISKGLSFVKSEVLREPFAKDKSVFSDLFSLRWFERVQRHYRVEACRRGLIRFGPAELEYKGFLGLFKNHKQYKTKKELVVYPRTLPFSEKNFEPRFLFGSRSDRGWIHKDPLNSVGVRPYSTTDSTKQINWKASARHRRLESNIYNPSQDPEIHIFLAAPRGEAWWKEEVKNHFELAVICAASIAKRAFEDGYGVGFYTNAKQQGKNNRRYIRPGRHSRQREQVLTTLALLEPLGQQEINKLIRNSKQEIKANSSVVFIGLRWKPEIRVLLSDYSRQYSLTIISVGKKMPQPVPPNARHLHLKGEEEWDEIETLQFV